MLFSQVICPSNNTDSEDTKARMIIHTNMHESANNQCRYRLPIIISVPSMGHIACYVSVAVLYSLLLHSFLIVIAIYNV